MEDPGVMLRALLLVIVANSAAWLTGRFLGPRWAAPLDLGIVLRDGRRLFGAHKTWRGLVSAMLATGVAADLTGWEFLPGAGFGAASLAGDALSSAIKRRRALPPGTEVPGLDQVPEALLPLLLFGPALGLHPVGITLITLTFLLLNVAVTGIRQRG